MLDTVTQPAPSPIERLLGELNPEQRAAATTQDQNVLVLAGAGSGKTKTIVARAAYLISQGIPPEQIQIVTFTRRAASEIVSRVENHLGLQAKGLKASTFHTFCMAILRRYARTFELQNFSIIDRDDQLTIFRLLRSRQIEEEFSEMSRNDRKEVEQNFPKAAQLTDIYSYSRNTLRKLSEVVLEHHPDLDDYLDSMKQIMQHYEEHKKERNYLDYDDILEYVARYLHASSDLADKVTGQVQHLLVDEMQDTNPLQWLLLEPFIGRSNLFCVGDDAQSIYGFRGADFENIHSFQNRIPHSTVLTLDMNYRSTQEILDVSNWLLDQSELDYKKRLRAHRGPGHTPILHTFEDEYREAAWIAGDLQRRHNAGIPWREHMILLRSAFSGRAVESALIAAQIPYTFIGGMKLLESAHVKDVLSLMRVASNPRDDLAWLRFLTLWKGVGDTIANRIIAQLHRCSSREEYLEILRQSGKLPPEVANSFEMALQQVDNPRRCLEVAVGYLTPQLEVIYRNNDWDARVRDFELVRQLASKHDTVPEFIEAYVLEPVSSSQIENEEIDDIVTLITIHSAKGTEREVCYVASASVGNYPHSRAKGYDEIEEERRVLYVAMTRAMNELIMTRSSRTTWAEDKYDSEGRKLSAYFLKEVPQELLQDRIHDSWQRAGQDRARGPSRKPHVGIDLD